MLSSGSRTMMLSGYRRSMSALSNVSSLLSRPSSSWTRSQQRILRNDIQLSRRHFAAASPTPSNDDDDKQDNNNSSTNTKPKTSSSVLLHLKEGSIVPGLGLAYVTALAGFSTASAISGAIGIPLSGIPVSILLGMTIKNTVMSPDRTHLFQPGITFATKTVLQAGIVCVAAKLSFIEVLTTGSAGIPVVASSLTAGMLFIPMASRMAGLPTTMSLLLTAGTSICGVTAITALAPAINAPHRDIAVAVANTVVLGTVGMLAYPYLFHYLCSSSEQIGMCLGVSIHDTSQVLGAALSCKEVFGDEVAFKVAAVTKLMRNLGLAVAIPVLTYSYHKSTDSESTDESSKEESQEGKDGTKDEKPASQESTMSGMNTFTKFVPPFLVAFLGVSALRSVGDYMIPDMEAYQMVMNYCGNELSRDALGVAMAGVGLSTSASSLKGVGWKPFAVGTAGALVVGGTGFTVAMLTV